MKFSFSETDKALLQLGEALKAGDYRFITSTPLSHARVNARSENAWAKNLRDIFGWSRAFQREIVSDEIWELMNAAQIVEEVEGGYKSTLRASNLDYNLLYHSAFPTTQNDAVFFGPDTYRFANAITNWTARYRSTQSPRRIADIGCGSGAGAILAAETFPDAQVFAGDINNAALRLTKINAALAQAPNIEARYSDLLHGFEGGFDLILANPPYLLDAGERAYRHGGGNFGEGLAIKILEAATERLNRGGTLLLYTGVAVTEGRDVFFHEAVRRVAALKWELTYQEVDPDVFGEELENAPYRDVERIAAVVLTMTKTD